MKLESFILQLLQENEIAIIPGFGAFYVNYQPAIINPETNEIIPPSKTISFNPKVRNNDGMLVGIIAQNVNISHFDALKKIEKERDNLLNRLDKGEKIVIKSIGSIWINENKEIEFESGAGNEIFTDSFGLENIPLITVEKQDRSVVSNKHEIYDETVKVSQPETINEEQNNEEKPGEVEELPKFGTIIQQETSQEKLAEKNEVTENKNETKEKKKKGWLWFLLFIPAVITGYFLVVKNNPKNTPVILEHHSDSTTKPLANEIISDTILLDSIPIKNQDTLIVDSEKPETTAEEITPPYYVLVGGSFQEKENADKYLSEIKEKGYEPFHLGKRGSFFLVGIGKFKKFGDAEQAKTEFVEKNPGSGVWIKKEQ